MTLLVAINAAIAIYALTQRCGYADLLLLYWMETVVIGVLGLPKILIVALFRDRVDDIETARRAGERLLFVMMMLLFLVVAFTCLVLIVYLAIIALPSLLERADRAAGFAVARGPRRSGLDLEGSIAALALSHLVSFVVNFLHGREFRGGSVVRLALQPFLRAGAIVAVILLGAATARLLPFFSRTTVFAVTILVTKIAVDVVSHLAERRRFRWAAAVPPPIPA